MKITIEAENLGEALKPCLGLHYRDYEAIDGMEDELGKEADTLNTLRISTSGENKITLTVVDKRDGIQVDSLCLAKVEEQGVYFCHLHRFKKLIDSTDHKTITIINDEIVFGKNVVQLSGIGIQPFNISNPSNLPGRIILDREMLKTILQSTLYAVYCGQGSPNQKGLCITRVTDNTIKCLATNGKTLAQHVANVTEVDFGEMDQLRIPREVLNLAEEFLDHFLTIPGSPFDLGTFLFTPESIELLFNNDVIQLVGAGLTVTGEIPEGPFVDCSKVIPDKSTNPYSITLLRGQLLEASYLIKALDNFRSGIILRYQLGLLNFSTSKRNKYGSSLGVLEVKEVSSNMDSFLLDSEGVLMYVDAHLLVNALESTKNLFIEINLSPDQQAPILLTGGLDTSSPLNAVLMPMQVIYETTD